jgi:hypothetical protein
MDPQTLSQATVLYAFSTLALVCAALVVCLGEWLAWETALPWPWPVSI